MRGIKRFYFSCIFAGIFCVCAFILIVSVSLEKEILVQNTEKKENEVLYFAPETENAGFFVSFEGGGSEYFYLDFENNRISVMFVDSVETVERAGYSVYSYILADYDFLSAFIDRFFGVELEQNGEIMRYTGVQATELLAKSTDVGLKEDMIAAVFDRIHNVGFSKNDLVFIIENTKNDLSYPKGYPYIDGFDNLADDVYFVNQKKHLT